eukprot:4956074-Prymnesium_polylepis.3
MVARLARPTPAVRALADLDIDAVWRSPTRRKLRTRRRTDCTLHKSRRRRCEVRARAERPLVALPALRALALVPKLTTRHRCESASQRLRSEQVVATYHWA